MGALVLRVCGQMGQVPFSLLPRYIDFDHVNDIHACHTTESNSGLLRQPQLVIV